MLSAEELQELRQERDVTLDTVDALLSECERYLKRIQELEAKFTPATRDRVLSTLGVGKQSPQYKRVKAVLDQFVNEVQGDGQKEKE